jgi:hypothetical protein
MLALLIRILLALRSVEGRTSREAKILDLREQLLVFSRRSRKPVRLRTVDWLMLVYLYRPFPSLLDAIIVVKPETLLRWHRRGFRAYWLCLMKFESEPKFESVRRSNVVRTDRTGTSCDRNRALLPP